MYITTIKYICISKREAFFEIFETPLNLIKMENTIDRVWEYSKNNPFGFTINIETFRPVKFGYAAAYLETQNCFGKEGLRKVVSHAMRHEKIVGGWLNSENEMYYFDSIKIFRSLEKAIEFAKENKQIAIFDLTNMIEIITTGG